MTHNRKIEHMENGILNSSTIPVLEQVINFAQNRHEVLTGNVANMNVPGYQVRDLSVETFQERLQDALIESRQRSEPLSPGMKSSKPNSKIREVSDSIPSILHHDGTNVGIEQQVLQINKNQFMHNLAISLMSSQFQMLQTAISERV